MRKRLLSTTSFLKKSEVSSGYISWGFSSSATLSHIKPITIISNEPLGQQRTTFVNLQARQNQVKALVQARSMASQISAEPDVEATRLFDKFYQQYPQEHKNGWYLTLVGGFHVLFLRYLM
jgi:hypothetical protein